jgi:hypothetical protein
VDVLEPAFVNLDGGNHGNVVGNIVMDVCYKGDSRSHEFGIVSVRGENSDIVALDTVVRVSEAKTYLEKFGVE